MSYKDEKKGYYVTDYCPTTQRFLQNITNNNMETKKLDEWDCQVIKAWKNDGRSISTARKIWGKRNAIDFEYPQLLFYINEHFLQLAQNLIFPHKEYQSREFIFHLDPMHNWRYGLNKNETDFQSILFSRLCSLFTNVEVKYLPGYVEWLESGKETSFFKQ